jgi:hypothetical protein
MSMYNWEDQYSQSRIGQQKTHISSQLINVIPTMYYIDELFQWLAYTFIEYFNLQLVQFWTPNNVNGANLRTMVARDSSLPEQVTVNEQMVLVARRFMGEQRMLPSQPVDILFPPHRSVLLKRYRLFFCSGTSMSGDLLLPPPSNGSAIDAREPAFFSLTALLFLSQSAHQDLIPAIRALLSQSVELALYRGLLLPSSTSTGLPKTFTTQQQAPALATLIPRLKENSNTMVTSNPFSRNAVISDKTARRLYAAIDSKKNVAELSRNMGMATKDVSAALQSLLKLQRIELLDTNGQVVDARQFFPESDL